MHLIPVLLDSRLPLCGNGNARDTLLTLPFGTGSVLDYLLSGLEGCGSSSTLVYANRSPIDGYESRLKGSASGRIEVVGLEELNDIAERSETSDFLFMVDPRRWPTAGYDLAELMRRGRRYRGATHAVAIGEDPERTREVVERDRQGKVKRVRRLYNRMSWPEVQSTGVFVSIVPAQSLRDVRFVSLAELRAALAAKGVFTQDLPVRSDVHDLGDECGILALGESMVQQVLSEPVPDGYSVAKPDVLVGRGCRIHPSASLVGPLIVQHDAVIDEGATVIGPGLIGRGARICRRAVVSQAMVGREAEIVADCGVTQRVVSGRHDGASEDASSAIGTFVVPRSIRGGARMGTNGTLLRPVRVRLDRRRRMQLAVKRIVDVVLSSVGLVALSPLLLLTAVLVKATSAGPVFFVHHREQRNGRDFPCLKFRTMRADAHKIQRELYERNEVDGPQFKMADDPRITPLGRLLRHANIDELPQLINVLLGHMSLVGPRPSPFRENQICVPWRRARLSVRPGVTGLWQLCRRRGEEGDFHEWIYYDMAYVRNLSFWLDLKILFYTVITKGGKKRVPLSRLIGEAKPGNGAGQRPAAGDQRSTARVQVSAGSAEARSEAENGYGETGEGARTEVESAAG
ncbi:MAG: sugar transferase [Phycisphaerae bacterium]|nr:sugar transferase [Phycisphaerae bacterium]